MMFLAGRKTGGEALRRRIRVGQSGKVLRLAEKLHINLHVTSSTGKPRKPPSGGRLARTPSIKIYG
jgi:hypothetical protein